MEIENIQEDITDLNKQKKQISELINANESARRKVDGKMMYNIYLLIG